MQCIPCSVERPSRGGCQDGQTGSAGQHRTRRAAGHRHVRQGTVTPQKHPGQGHGYIAGGTPDPVRSSAPQRTAPALRAPLEVGDRVRVQNQTGPHKTRWSRMGQVMEVNRAHDQYHVKMDGSRRTTARNRKFLRKIRADPTVLGQRDGAKVPPRQPVWVQEPAETVPGTPPRQETRAAVQPSTPPRLGPGTPANQPDQTPRTRSAGLARRVSFSPEDGLGHEAEVQLEVQAVQAQPEQPGSQGQQPAQPGGQVQPRPEQPTQSEQGGGCRAGMMTMRCPKCQSWKISAVGPPHSGRTTAWGDEGRWH